MTRDREWKRLIGEAIRTARLLKGWTQEDLAQQLVNIGFTRCSRSLLSKVESGISVIRGYELYYVRLIFGPKFEELFWSPLREESQRES